MKSKSSFVSSAVTACCPVTFLNSGCLMGRGTNACESQRDPVFRPR